MTVPRKPGYWDAFRKKRALAAKERAERRQRRQWINAQKAAERNQSIARFLDWPSAWLERQRKQKIRLEAKRQYDNLGVAVPLTPSARLGKAARVWLAGITGNRERLWRRIALALGAVAVVSLAGNLVMYSRYSPTRPLVTVGSRVIQKREYLAALDAAAGKPVLTKLVFTELIQQAAARAGVTPTPAQIDARLAEIERSNPSSAPADTDSAEIRQNVALTLALENLRIQGISASDAEIADFYRKNGARLTPPVRVQSLLALTRSEFEAQTAASLLAKGKTAAEVAALPDTLVDGQNGFQFNLDHLPAPLHQKIFQTTVAMHPGQITTLPIGRVFLTIQCLHKGAPTLPPLGQIREEVTRLVRLEKGPSEDVELARLYQANRPYFDMDRYAAYLDDTGRANPSAPPALSKEGPP